MSKYIIDIPDGIEWGVITCRTEDGFYNRDFDSLEELNSDYINEHYGELRDEAYRKGYEDGKESTKNGCMGCKYETRTSREEPCKYCSNCHTSKYTPMPEKKDRIEVGDEVIWKTENITLIVTSTYEASGFNWCDGVMQNGKAYHVLMENVAKTGKHYDIQSILEAMRQ